MYGGYLALCMTTLSLMGCTVSIVLYMFPFPNCDMFWVLPSVSVLIKAGPILGLLSESV